MINDVSDQKGAKVTVFYNRISPGDGPGMVDIDANFRGMGFHYSCVGSHHGVQLEEGADHDRAMLCGKEIAAAVRKYFGAVKPLLDEDPKK